MTTGPAPLEFEDISRDPFSEHRGIIRLMIFGHPAHELALYGAISRLKPRILILTDGGSPARVSFSRKGLESMGALNNASYAGFREADFYQALLDHDTSYFDEVVACIRESIEAENPGQIFCDAVEFYNPVHDIIYVLLRAALKAKKPVPIFRIPLVFQRQEDDEYVIQRVPERLSFSRAQLRLSEQEALAKCTVRDEIYINLRDQAGGDFMGVSSSHAACEEVELDDPSRLEPGFDGRRLRYEWRADLLHRHGKVERVITYKEHFKPMVDHYLGFSSI